VRYFSYVMQPHRKHRYVDLFQMALERGEYSTLSAAVAYARDGGVDALNAAFATHDRTRWLAMTKRWLVAIDWCRSDPSALGALDGTDERFPKSKLRIHDGAAVVQRRGCVPRRPFHPKVFMLTGNTSIAVISGSGNLSRSGLTSGHEFGSVVVTDRVSPKALEPLRALRWFDSMFQAGTPWKRITKAYEAKYDQYSTQPVFPDEDAAPSFGEPVRPRRRAIPDDLLPRVSRARHLWIQFVPNENRGKDIPGNQLMMSPRTRVYFGARADDVPRDTSFEPVTVTYGGHARRECSLRYSNNSMDVLTLPVPGVDGPPTYDNQFLLFTRIAPSQFSMKIGTAAEAKRWKNRSQDRDLFFEMQTSRRPWGVY